MSHQAAVLSLLVIPAIAAAQLLHMFLEVVLPMSMHRYLPVKMEAWQ